MTETNKTDNLELWNLVEKTDPKHTKKVTFGRGFTAIDPYYQIKCATEQFGAAGEGWGWEIARMEVIGEIASLGLLVRLWHGSRESYIEQWGQGSLYTDNAKSKPDNDVLKKATTDGITKCLSYLGFNADVFTGKFDDNKYVQQMNREFEQMSPEPINMEHVAGAIKAFKEEIDKDDLDLGHERIQQGWGRLTNDERIAVQEGMKEKPEGSRKMYKNILIEYINYKPGVE